MGLLKDKIILVTKSRIDSDNSFQKLIDAGAKIINLPTIKIIPLDVTDDLKIILLNNNIFDYIIFTSSAAVKIFARLSEQTRFNPNKSKIAVVGKRTAEECINHRIKVDVLPEQYSAQGLINIFSKIDIVNRNIFIPCSKLSSDELKNSLAKLGSNVKSIPIYDVVVNDMNECFEEYQLTLANRPDVFLFTSPSSFKSYLKIFKVENVQEYFHKRIICAMGKTTANEINKNGLQVNIQPIISNLENISNEIIDFYQNKYAEHK